MTAATAQGIKAAKAREFEAYVAREWPIMAIKENHIGKIPADTKQVGPDVRERAETLLAWMISNPRQTRAKIREALGMTKSQLVDHMAVLTAKKQVRKVRIRGTDFYEATLDLSCIKNRVQS